VLGGRRRFVRACGNFNFTLVGWRGAGIEAHLDPERQIGCGIQTHSGNTKPPFARKAAAHPCGRYAPAEQLVTVGGRTANKKRAVATGRNDELPAHHK
jgi:hypothetical protein